MVPVGVPAAPAPIAPRRRWWHRSTVIGAAVAVMVLGSTSTAAGVTPRKPSPAEIAAVAAETSTGPVHGEFPVVSVDGSRLTRRWQWGEVVAIDQAHRAAGLSDSAGPADAGRPPGGTGSVEAARAALARPIAAGAAAATGAGVGAADGGAAGLALITVASEDGYASDYWVDPGRAAGLALGEWVTVVGELPAV